MNGNPLDSVEVVITTLLGHHVTLYALTALNATDPNTPTGRISAWRQREKQLVIFATAQR